MDCTVVGDSIALGFKNKLPECIYHAKNGINSWQWNNSYSDKLISSETVIISLGTNDHKNVKTKQELELIRNRVKSKHVVWILPSEKVEETTRNIIVLIAKANRDTVLPIQYLQADKIHPSTRGYADLVEKLK